MVVQRRWKWPWEADSWSMCSLSHFFIRFLHHNSILSKHWELENSFPTTGWSNGWHLLLARKEIRSRAFATPSFSLSVATTSPSWTSPWWRRSSITFQQEHPHVPSSTTHKSSSQVFIYTKYFSYIAFFFSSNKQTIGYRISLKVTTSDISGILSLSPLLSYLAGFHKYDFGSCSENQAVYGQCQPPNYDPLKVTAPVVTYWSKNDWLVHPTVSETPPCSSHGISLNDHICTSGPCAFDLAIAEFSGLLWGALWEMESPGLFVGNWCPSHSLSRDHQEHGALS